MTNLNMKGALSTYMTALAISIGFIGCLRSKKYLYKIQILCMCIIILTVPYM